MASGTYRHAAIIPTSSGVSGCVCMEVKEEISGIVCCPSIPYKESTTDGVINTKTARSCRPLVELDIPMDASKVIQGGKIQPGKYELPFEIELRDILPSTIAEGNSPGCQCCSLEYGIEVDVKGCEHPQDYACRDRAAIVGKPLFKDPVPDMNTLESALTNTASQPCNIRTPSII